MSAKSQLQAIDRMPPHCDEGERGVLSCILMSPREVMAECLIGLSEDAFYDLRYRLIYHACCALYDRGTPIDPITLQGECHSEQVTGELLTQLWLNEAPSSANLPTYLQTLREKLALRRLLQFCTENAVRAYETNGDFPEFLDHFETAALSIRRSHEKVAGLVDVKAVQHQLMEDYEAAEQRQQPMGIATGFHDLDRLCGGMMAQEMIVLAGLRSSGKTTLALNVAWNVCLAGIAVGILSLETSAKKILHRLLCNAGRFDGSGLLRGRTTQQDAPKAVLAMATLSKARQRLFLSDSGNLSLRELAALARRMHQQGARVFVIDYLQLLDCPGRTEYEKVTAASRAIKNIAKELDAPVIILCSLNRESDKDSRPPRLSDLRASGQIEYDADKAWLLHCDSHDEMRDVTLNVAKHKDGPTGEIKLTFFASQFRMESQSKVYDTTLPYPDP